jgi:hypothetical protein
LTLLKLEKELLKQIKLDPFSQIIYGWIWFKLHVDKEFVNILNRTSIYIYLWF